MKIMTLNVGIWTRNWRRSDTHYWLTRARAMKNMIKEQKPDVICFQELWFPHNLWIPKGYRKILGTGLEHPIYCRKGLKATHSSFHFFWSEATVEGTDIFCVHSRWEAKYNQKVCRQLRDMYRYSSRPAVLSGDFNNSWATLSPLLPELATARGSLPQKDTFRNFTRPESHGELDHILTTAGSVEHFALINEDNPFAFSDHLALVAVI